MIILGIYLFITADFSRKNFLKSKMQVYKAMMPINMILSYYCMTHASKLGTSLVWHNIDCV